MVAPDSAPTPQSREELLYEALTAAKKAIRRLLGPEDITRVELPHSLREAFLRTDRIIRSIGLDIEQNKHNLGSARYVRFGAFARDWVAVRAAMGTQIQALSAQAAIIETFHKRAMALAEEMLSSSPTGNKVGKTFMQGEPAPKTGSSLFSWKMALLVSGSVGALWLVKAYLDKPGPSPFPIEETE